MWIDDGAFYFIFFFLLLLFYYIVYAAHSLYVLRIEEAVLGKKWKERERERENKGTLWQGKFLFFFFGGKTVYLERCVNACILTLGLVAVKFWRASLLLFDNNEKSRYLWKSSEIIKWYFKTKLKLHYRFLFVLFEVSYFGQNLQTLMVYDIIYSTVVSSLI